MAENFHGEAPNFYRILIQLFIIRIEIMVR